MKGREKSRITVFVTPGSGLTTSVRGGVVDPLGPPGLLAPSEPPPPQPLRNVSADTSNSTPRCASSDFIRARIEHPLDTLRRAEGAGYVAEKPSAPTGPHAIGRLRPCPMLTDPSAQTAPLFLSSRCRRSPARVCSDPFSRC